MRTEKLNNLSSRLKIVTAILLLIVLLLLIWQANYIAKHTIIATGYLIKYAMISGFWLILIFLFFKRDWLEDLLLLLWLYATMSFFAGMIILYANFFSFSAEYKTVTLALEDKRIFETSAGKEKPVASLSYNNQSKTTWFKALEKDQFEKADSVALQLREGNLGFAIFREYEFVDR